MKPESKPFSKDYHREGMLRLWLAARLQPPIHLYREEVPAGHSLPRGDK